MMRGVDTYQFVKDHLGSIKLVVKVSDGSVAQEITYDEFGKVLSDTNPGFQPFGFAGGVYDAQTSLTKFGVRDYDAEVGRWLTKDPILFAGGDANLYGYVLMDPVNLIDPQGEAFAIPLVIPLLGKALEICALGALSLTLSQSSKASAEQCKKERAEGFEGCKNLRDVHDGSQGKCYDNVAQKYMRCIRGL